MQPHNPVNEQSNPQEPRNGQQVDPTPGWIPFVTVMGSAVALAFAMVWVGIFVG